jgi:lipoprotein-releasing system permease protein
MAKLNTELFVARRIGGSGDGSGSGSNSGDGSGGNSGGLNGAGGSGGDSRGVMVRIATATTAVAIAVMIVAVAVISGFRKEIAAKITAFAGHLHISALDVGGSLDTAPIRLDSALERDIAALDGFRSITPYSLKSGLVKTDEATQGIVLKGVTADYDMSFFEDCLVSGVLPRIGDSVRHKDILVSADIARMLRLAVDDRVEILFVNEDRPPRRDRFRVSGLYSSGLGEMDSRFVLGDMADVQRLNDWEADRVTGYEIIIDDMARLEQFEAEAFTVALRHDRGAPPLVARSVYGDYPQLFDWLATHNVNAAVIITIMIAVALISMVSALLIILLERIRMIGILKTLGMRNGSLRRIFILRSARILVLGLLIGDVAGIGLALTQRYTGFLKLDSSGYFLSSVPIALDVWWIVALNVGTLLVILALLVFPTNIIGRITPEKTIRYQ